jgi:hypothetical protein
LNDSAGGVWRTIGVVLVCAIYAFLNLIVMGFVGFGGLANTYVGKSATLLGIAYLLFELLGIYVLLAWTSKRVRNGAHIGFCVPWAMLMIIVVPQMLSRTGFREGLPLLTSALLVWVVRYPGEWLSQTLHRGNDAEQESATSTPENRKARILIWASITWAAVGLAQLLNILAAIPIIGRPLSGLALFVQYRLPLTFILNAALLAAPGIALAVFANRAGAAEAFPLVPKIAWGCTVANLAIWLYPVFRILPYLFG